MQGRLRKVDVPAQRLLQERSKSQRQLCTNSRKLPPVRFKNPVTHFARTRQRAPTGHWALKKCLYRPSLKNWKMNSTHNLWAEKNFNRTFFFAEWQQGVVDHKSLVLLDQQTRCEGRLSRAYQCIRCNAGCTPILG